MALLVASGCVLALGQGLVEELRRAAGEAGVDDVSQSLPERQHTAGGDQQREQREQDAPLVRQEKLGEPGEQLQILSTCTRQS